MSCHCPTEGYCPVLDRNMRAKNRNLCVNTNCDLGESLLWQDFWQRDAKARGVYNPECICQQDGYCEKFNRPMFGRDRQICRGENVDLGTVAELKAQWSVPRRIQLITAQAPGDAIAATAAIYSLHTAYPNKFVTTVSTQYPDIFKYNPHIVSEVGKPTTLTIHYPAIHDSMRRGISFIGALTEFLGDALHVPLRLETNRPHVYFPDGDTSQSPNGDWLICSGVKDDFTTKRWNKWQEVVDALPSINFVQVGAKEHEHQRLKGATDLVGSTSLRELFALTRRCSGVICSVTMLMHIAAAFQKPAVIIAGGREPATWNSYPFQHYLHSGLPCAGCWIPKIEQCKLPSTPTMSACMDSISAAEVINLIVRLQKHIL